MKEVQNKNFCYLYRHIRLDTLVPFYIGIGSDLHFTRAFSTESRNNHWKNIVKKTTYKVEILLKDLSWEEACKKECKFINIYGRSDLKLGTLCNKTNGGEGAIGVIISEETRKRMSYAQIGKKQNEETKKKVSESLKGNKRTLGKKHTEETRKKMSDAQKGKKNHFFGKKHSLEKKEIISQRQKGNKNMLGKKHTEETRKKMSDSQKGKISLFLGKKHTEESKKKNSEAKKEWWRLKKITKIQYAS